MVQAERIWDDELNRYLTPQEMAYENVYLTEEEAAGIIFEDSDRILTATMSLTSEEKEHIEARIGWNFPETSFIVFIGESRIEGKAERARDNGDLEKEASRKAGNNGSESHEKHKGAPSPSDNGHVPNGRYLDPEAGWKIDGYAILQNTVGKHKPMTYMVGVNPDLTVKEVELLIYRESRGEEVGTERFNYQYEGKDLYDPIRINRDVINISGATMSVRSMSAGVKRALVIVDECYLKPRGIGSNLTASRKEEKGFLESMFGF